MGAILVTGAAGFIGSHLCERLLEEGFEVIGVDCFTDFYDPARKRQNVSALMGRRGFRLLELDLASADIERVLDGIDCVFHLAAQAGVRSSWGRDFENYLRFNVLATQRLLEALKCTPAVKLVHASSSSVYGNAKKLPTREDHPTFPISPYGATKLAAEHLLHLYRENYGVAFVALRLFTVYGPRQRPDMAFSRFILSALAGEPITVYGDGSQTRDFTFVSDAIEAMLAAMEYEGEETVFNIGGGSRVSIAETLAVIERSLRTKLEIVNHEPAKGDVADTLADTSLARRELKFAPRVALADGLEREIEWYRQSFAGYRGRKNPA